MDVEQLGPYSPCPFIPEEISPKTLLERQLHGAYQWTVKVNRNLQQRLGALETSFAAYKEETDKALEAAKDEANEAANKGWETEEDDKKAGYHTEEEEFDSDARDNSWILNLGKKTKKRKRNGSPIRRVSPIKNASKTQEDNKKSYRPPPIFIHWAKDVQTIIRHLKEKSMKTTLTTMSTEGNFKLSPPTEEEYRQMTSWLNEANIEWHSFSNKHSRPVRVMARGLNATTPPEDIIQALVAHGFMATNAVNILAHKTKKPLNLFMLTFSDKQDPRTLYDIKTIDNQVVKIEEVSKKGSKIVQCKNCQDFNHVRSFCHRQPKCVKCAGPHKTEECKKTKDEAPKCANCEGEHPASYRGCSYARGLQIARNNNKQKREMKTRPTSTAPTTKKISPSVTFAEMLKGKTENLQEKATDPGDPVSILTEKINLLLLQQQQLQEFVFKELEAIKKTISGQPAHK